MASGTPTEDRDPVQDRVRADDRIEEFIEENDLEVMEIIGQGTSNLINTLATAIADGLNPNVTCSTQNKWQQAYVKLELKEISDRDDIKTQLKGFDTKPESALDVLLKAYAAKHGWDVVALASVDQNLNRSFVLTDYDDALKAIADGKCFAVRCHKNDEIITAPFAHVRDTNDVDKHAEVVVHLETNSKYSQDPRFRNFTSRWVQAHELPEHDCAAVAAKQAQEAAEETEKINAEQSKARRAELRREIRETRADIVEIDSDENLKPHEKAPAKRRLQKRLDVLLAEKAPLLEKQRDRKRHNKEAPRKKKQRKAQYNLDMRAKYEEWVEDLAEHAARHTAGKAAGEQQPERPDFDEMSDHLSEDFLSAGSSTEWSDDDAKSDVSSIDGGEDDVPDFIVPRGRFHRNADGQVFTERLPAYEDLLPEIENFKAKKTTPAEQQVDPTVKLIRLQKSGHSTDNLRLVKKDNFMNAKIPSPTASDQLIPKMKASDKKNWDGANLEVSIHSQAFAPSMRLAVRIYRKNSPKQSDYYGHVDFFFAPIKHIIDEYHENGRPKSVNKRGCQDFQYEFAADGKSCNISWRSQIGVPENLNYDNTPRKARGLVLRPPEKELMTELKRLAEPSREGQRVTVTVFLDDAQQQARAACADFDVGNLILKLPNAENVGASRFHPSRSEYDQPTSHPHPAMSKAFMHPYMRASGYPATASGFIGPKQMIVNDDHPWLSFEHPSSSWVDERHAEIELTYGANTMHEVAANEEAAIGRNVHKCTVWTQNGTVFNLVKFTVRPQLGFHGEVLKIEPGTQIEVELKAGSLDRALHAKTLVIADSFGFGADLVLLVCDKDREYFQSLPTTWGDAKPDEVEPVDIKLKIVPNEAVRAAQVSTANKIYNINQQHGTDGRWLPALLARGDEKLEITDPLLHGLEQDSQEAKALHDKFKRWVKGSSNFNDDQQRALGAMRKLVAKMMLMRGPPGTGKTHLLIALAIFLVENVPGHKVYIGSQNHSVCDDITVKVIAAIKKANSKIKVLRTASSARTGLHNYLQAGTRESDAELLLFQSFENLKEKYTLHGRTMHQASIEKEIVDLAKSDGPPIMKQYTQESPADPSKQEAYGEAVDFKAEFLRFLPKLEKEPLNGKNPATGEPLWTEEDKKKAGQVFCHLRDLVAADTDILIGTTFSTNVRAYACFAEAASAVWVIEDEAPTINEVNSLIPLALPRWASKIVAVLLFGDPAQLRPLAFDSNFNVFLNRMELSLYQRLANLGWKEHLMRQQHRMDEVILAPSNKIYYGNQLRTAVARKSQSLPAGFINTARRCFGLPPDATLSEQQMRLAYLVVDSGVLRKSSLTRSKANYESFYHVCFILRQLRKLLGTQMCELVGVASFYKRQIELYHEFIWKMRSEEGWTEEECPYMIVTVDSSQGRECAIMIIDTVITDVNAQGFVGDAHRGCVSLTRAKEVQWVIGTSLGVSKFKDQADFDDPNEPVKNNHSLPRYKDELVKDKCDHTILEELIKHPALADIHYDLLLEEELEPATDDPAGAGQDDSWGGDGDGNVPDPWATNGATNGQTNAWNSEEAGNGQASDWNSEAPAIVPDAKASTIVEQAPKPTAETPVETEQETAVLTPEVNASTTVEQTPKPTAETPVLTPEVKQAQPAVSQDTDTEIGLSTFDREAAAGLHQVEEVHDPWRDEKGTNTLADDYDDPDVPQRERDYGE